MKIQLIIGGVEKAGGAERVMCVLANTFADLGHDVVLSVLSSDSQPFYSLNDAVRYVQTGKTVNIPLMRYIHKLLRIRRLMKKETPDVAISFITPMNCASILLSYGLNRKVFVSERIAPSYYDNTKIGKFRELLYPLATGVVCQTNEAKEYFANSRCYKRCVVIRNPLTTAIVEKKDYSSSFRICAVGRLTDQKNYPLMFKAFKQFVQTHPEYTLDVFGTGERKEKLEQLIAELGLSSRIRLCGNVDNLGSILHIYDFFLMTSNYEGMSNALAEAMAAGLPCLCTDCQGGGASDLIISGENGLLVPIEDGDSLKCEMKKLAACKPLRETLGKEAKQIKEILSCDKIAEQWIDLIKRA